MDFCSALIAMGMTLGGICIEPVEKKMDLPSEDPTVWSYTAPPEPKPAPKPLPAFPPVTIYKEVVREVRVPTPKAEVIVVKEAKPDPYRMWLEARARTTSQAPSQEWREISVVPETSNLSPLNALGTSSFSPPKIEKASYSAEKTISSEPVTNDRKITTDRYISGILETGINSQLSSKDGGQVIIQVSRDVYGYGTRNKLIPKGSRLVCDYETPTSLNATRVALKCIRALLAGDKHGRRVEIANLEAPVGDPQGRGGRTGEVNNHFEKKYGTAIMMSLISATVRGASVAVSSGKEGDTTGEIAQTGAEELSTRFGEITAAVLEKTVNIMPTITLAQGTRVQIRPRKDWYLKEIK